MSPGWVMDAECIHGSVWYECAECAKDDPSDEPKLARRAAETKENPT